MKANNITVLIALIAIIGTFTSVMSQDAMATGLDGNGFCLLTGSPAVNPNGDEHTDIGITIDPSGGPTFQVQLASMFSTPGAGTPLTSLVNFKIHQNTGTLATPVLGTFVGNVPSTDETVSDPKDFTGTFVTGTLFPLLTEGNFVGFYCGEETENESTPDPELGIHNSDSAPFRIDRTAPVFPSGDDPQGCQDLEVQQAETDGNTIPREDPRFDSFFDVFATDALDDDLVQTDDAPDDIPVGSTLVTFRASDDGDIPTENDNNTSEVSCTLTVISFERPGCEGRTLDQNGDLTVQFCLETTVEEAQCILAILGNNPTLPYGTLSQGDTSDFHSLFMTNLGNAPAELKVIVTGWLTTLTNPPAGVEKMQGAQTHFGVVLPGATTPVDYYDGPNSFAVSETVLTIIDPIFNAAELLETIWQLRIDLSPDPLYFGDLEQTMNLRLQDCSTANHCELRGGEFGPCAEVGDTRELPGRAVAAP